MGFIMIPSGKADGTGRHNDESFLGNTTLAGGKTAAVATTGREIKNSYPGQGYDNRSEVIQPRRGWNKRETKTGGVVPLWRDSTTG